LVDKAKTKLIIEPEMDGDEQNNHLNIWEDHLSMKLLTGGSLDINAYTLVDIERAKKN